MIEHKEINIKKIFKESFPFLCFLLFLTLIAYSVTFFNEFVSDDIAGIANNPNLSNLLLQLKTFSPTNIIFSIIYNLFGPIPFWFHLLSILFHLATIVVVYYLVFIIGENKFIAQITSLLFALHPIETESVAWISAFPYNFYTFFFYLAFLIFILVEKKVLNNKWIFLTAVLYLISLLSSIIAIIFPLVLFAYLFIFSKISWQKAKLAIPTIIVFLVYSLTIAGKISQRVEALSLNPASPQVELFDPFEQIPYVFFTSFKLFLVPFTLSLYHETFILSTFEYIAALFLIVYLFLLIYFFLKKEKIVSFGLLWFTTSLIPMLIPLNLGSALFAERYLRIGSLGMFLFFAWFFRRFTGRFKTVSWLKTAVILVLALLLTTLTIKRNLEWKNEDALWLSAVKTAPRSSYAQNNLGVYYGRRGSWQSAIGAFEKAKNLDPNRPGPYYNLAFSYLMLEDADKAVAYLQKALSLSPKQYNAAALLANIYFNKKEYDASEKYLLQAIKYNPDPFKNYLDLYIVYKNLQDEDKAQEVLKKAQDLVKDSKEDTQKLNNYLNSIVVTANN